MITLLKKTVETYEVDIFEIGCWQATCEQHEETIANLQQIIKEMKDKLLFMFKGEEMSAKLLVQQQQVSKSLQAFAEKQLKTKLITGDHHIRYTNTEPKQMVYDETAMANQRLRKEEQAANISRLAGIVDEVAAKYSPHFARLVPYSNTNNLVQQALHPDDLPPAIPREFFALWTFLVEPTKEEEKMYDFFIQSRPPPIFSPHFFKPRVNWSRLNKHHLKNLPEPELFPVHSCPADPGFYTTTHLRPGQTYVQRYLQRSQGCQGRSSSCGCVRCDPPFGLSRGLETNHGIVAMPEEPVHGYIWVGKWVIAAVG